MKCPKIVRPHAWALLVALLVLGSGAGGASAAGQPAAAVQAPAQAKPNDQVMEKAQAARRAGRLTEAADLFAQARKAEPFNVEAARGACQVALALGRGLAAREACQRAQMLGVTAEDIRLNVSAMVNIDPPAMSELALAVMLAEGAVKKSPREPWGYAARCDIARRLGDADALVACLETLRMVAPEHEETKRVFVRSGGSATPWVWLGRLLLALALVGTPAHFAWRRLRQLRARRGGATSAAPASLALLLVLSAGALGLGLPAPRTARAEPSEGGGRMSNFAIDDADPESSIPSVEKQNRDPLEFGYLLQDLLDKALAAEKRNDHAAAIRYYRALVKAAPMRSISYAKLCQALMAAGDRDRAVLACRAATERDGVRVEDFARYVRLVLAKSGPLTPAELGDLDLTLMHLARQPDQSLVAEQLRCEVALATHDVPALQKCTAALTKAAPKDAATISFQWALAVETRDAGEARRLVARAREVGMAKAGVERMEAATDTLTNRKLLRIALGGAAAALVGAALFFSSRRRAAMRRRVPAPASGL